MALYERGARYEANHDFAQFTREGAEYIDPNIVQQDLDQLKKLGHDVENFADKRIAHYDKQLVENVPSFGELDDCIDFLAELTGKYWLLFKAEALVDLLVMPIVDYWMKSFANRGYLLMRQINLWIQIRWECIEKVGERKRVRLHEDLKN